MKGLELKEDGFIAWSYKWVSTQEKLPQSLCTLFWAVLFGWLTMLATLPMTLLMACSRSMRKEPTTYGIVPSLVVTMIGVVLSLLSIEIINATWQGFLDGLLHFALFIVFIICLGLSVAILMGIFHLLREGFFMIFDRPSPSKPKPKKEKKESELVTLIKEYKKAYFGKYCPKIDWK